MDEYTRFTNPKTNFEHYKEEYITMFLELYNEFDKTYNRNIGEIQVSPQLINTFNLYNDLFIDLSDEKKEAIFTPLYYLCAGKFHPAYVWEFFAQDINEEEGEQYD